MGNGGIHLGRRKSKLARDRNKGSISGETPEFRESAPLLASCYRGRTKTPPA